MRALDFLNKWSNATPNMGGHTSQNSADYQTSEEGIAAHPWSDTIGEWNKNNGTANNENVTGDDPEELVKDMTAAERMQWEAFKKSIEENSKEAEKGREFQREYAKNKYTWMMEDLKKAGINPTLLFGGGLDGGGITTATAHNGTPNFVAENRGKNQVNKELLELGKIITSVFTFLGLKMFIR